MADSPRNSLGSQFSVLTDFIGGERNTYSNDRFLQTGDSGGTTDYSTIGPERNEVFTTYTYEKGTHHIRFLAYVSPDILLVHQSKVAGFYRALGSNRTLDPMGRNVKDQILRGSSANIRSDSTAVSSSVSTSSPVSISTTSTSSSY